MTEAECTCDSPDYGTALDCPIHGVHVEPQRFPEPHYPPRKQEGGPDIVLMAYSCTLTCGGCGLTRNLPEGWQEMLGTNTLTCTECNLTMIEAERRSELPSEDEAEA